MQFDASSQNIALVVDDNPEALSFVSAALEDAGMTVLVARDGQSAIDLVQRVQPDVIMMDAVMPGLDGFETCRRLKGQPIATDAPIIFMTGLSDNEHILRGLSCGGVDYLTKPIQLEQMVARVTIHLLNSKLVKSAREALDSSGKMVLAIHEEGKVAWGSPKAMELINVAGVDVIDKDTANPDILNWLKKVSRQPISQSQALQSNGIALNFIGRSSNGDLLLRVSKANADSAQEQLAETLDLTPREGDVLFWLSQGKTNRDIAEILELSARTINKHLEQIFQKLGVDNRTSAAVMADRILHSDGAPSARERI